MALRQFSGGVPDNLFPGFRLPQTHLVMDNISPDFLLRSYLFDLPEERIAQWPAPERAQSRLMVLPRPGNAATITSFGKILEYLPEKCVLVANNSRVVPARLSGARAGGGKVELLLLTPLPLLRRQPMPDTRAFSGWEMAEAEALLRPARKMSPGDLVRFGPALAVEILERGDFGRFRINLLWHGDLLSLLERQGTPPLPPYIKRPARGNQGQAATDDAPPGKDVPAYAAAAPATDMERYQTVYARREQSGSVAAPTAGLHFTPELCEALLRSGREWVELTLHVGYGTFSPVRKADIREHEMHAEYVEVDRKAAQAITRAKAQGRAVIAVGTTSCRALEGICEIQGRTGRILPFSGWVNHFLYPGRAFHVIDGMITNFHLPGSSLLMLVSALAGRERILAAYQEAIAREFRFFSYGDAMLILP